MGELAWLTLGGGEDGTEEDGISVAGRQVGVSAGLGIEGTVRGPREPKKYLVNVTLFWRF